MYMCRGHYVSMSLIEVRTERDIELDYLSIYQLLFAHLSAGSESPIVEETMVKSWFRGQSKYSLVIFDSADSVRR